MTRYHNWIEMRHNAKITLSTTNERGKNNLPSLLDLLHVNDVERQFSLPLLWPIEVKVCVVSDSFV